MNKFLSIHDASLFLKNGGDGIYNIAKHDGGLCIDGGAAAGYVTKILLQSSSCYVLAFEPFPGNIPHFLKTVGDSKNYTLYQKALGRFTGNSNFYVSRTVDGNQPGWNHLQGYSSEGYLVADDQESKKGTHLVVDVVRLDDYITDNITLLKLDLQGGEYDALCGAGTKLEKVRYCYIEFSLDWRSLELLTSNEFIIFDTQYTGIPKIPIESLDGVFENANVINLSNGYKAVSGIIRGLPRDLHSYREFLENFKSRYFYHLWSDIIAVNNRYLSNFIISAIR